MAQIPGGFTPDFNDQYQGFEVLPAGEYKAQIIDTDVVETRAGDGQYIKIVYEVIGDARYNGRKLFDNINIVNPSVDAVRIGKQKLNTICALVGLKTIKDTAQLHGKALSLLVTVGKNKMTGDDTNVIKKYMDIGGGQAEPDVPQSGKKSSFIK